MFNNKSSWFIGILFAFATLYSCENEYSGKIIEMTFGTENAFIINETEEKLLATDKGLFLFNKSTEKFDYAESENNLKPLNDIAYSKNVALKELWFASNRGVLNFTGQNLYTRSNSGLYHNFVTRNDFDFGDRGVFTTPDGLPILDNNKWTGYSVEIHNILTNNIKFLAVDTDDSVWLASDEGLSKFADDQWINYT